MKPSSILVHEPTAIDQFADSFRGYEHTFKDAQDQSKRDLKTEAAEHRQKQVEEMIDGEITTAAWDELVGQARKAAEHGEKQYLLLRFPSELARMTHGRSIIPQIPHGPKPVEAKRRTFTSGGTPRFGHTDSTSRLRCLIFRVASPVMWACSYDGVNRRD